MVRRIHGHLRTAEGYTHKHTHTHSDKTGLKKGTWTPEEDRKLVAYVTTYGCWNWRQLPKYAGLKRCGKSCRLRWMNYLRPNIKRGNYSKEEDDIILKLHESLGNRWSAIAAHLPGRTDNEIKNHWHTSLKKRSEPNLISHEPKLSSMDLPKYGSIQEKKSNPNNTHPILESTPLSPQHSSSTTDTKCTTFLGEDDVEIFAEASGNFWTEPFLPDTGNDHFLAPLMHSGPLTPPSPVIGEEFLFFHGLYDETY